MVFMYSMKFDSDQDVLCLQVYTSGWVPTTGLLLFAVVGPKLWIVFRLHAHACLLLSHEILYSICNNFPMGKTMYHMTTKAEITKKIQPMVPYEPTVRTPEAPALYIYVSFLFLNPNVLNITRLYYCVLFALGVLRIAGDRWK